MSKSLIFAHFLFFGERPEQFSHDHSFPLSYLCTIEHDTNGLSFTLFSYSFSCPLISDNERNFGFFYFTNSIYQRTTLILKKVSVADDVKNNF